jgi:branched-chain amino acid transport system permease protein
LTRYFIARLSPAVGLVGLLLLLAAVAKLFAPATLVSSLTEALVLMVMVVGMSIFVGNSGVISFGHIGFAMIGAYASAWQTCCVGMRQIFMPGLPDWLLAADVPVFLAATVGGLLAAAFGLVFGLVVMQLSGIAASIALLSILFVLKTVYENWQSVTAGQSSLVGLPLYVDLWTALGAACGAIVVAQLYLDSSFGLRLRAAREDEPAAQAAGVRIWSQRLIAFVLSAFIVAIGGVLYGHFLGTLAVNMFWLDLTFLTLAMLVVGGLRSLTGAVVGTLSVMVVRELLRSLEQGVSIAGHDVSFPNGVQEIGLALVLLAILIYRPQGLIGDRELGRPELK